ncbi:MAG: adenylate cyclase [Acetobacteraceae bacterium]|nr:adenylate cyclase [Acetobacteraceae bacterium]
MLPSDQQEFEFGPFKLDGRQRRLTRDGAPISVGGRALDILVVLAKSTDETVAKASLLDQVWPGLTVEENNLQVHISALRKALGEGWIITVPGRGYRLTVPPNGGKPSGPKTELPFERPVLPDRPSIAVLAFTNMSNDRDQEYFSDGIATDIITELSRTRWLFVIARNSSFTYRGRAVDLKQVARELGVRYILEGSVRRSGDRVRVTAQLIEAENVSHIWADRYDRGVSEVFAVQDEITAAVTTAILPAVTDSEQRRAMRRSPESLDAWEAYQRGLWHLGKFTPMADNEQARGFFRNSIMLDPAFASAYTGLSLTYTREILSYSAPRSSALLTSAESWARKAVDIDANDAEAHAILAHATTLAGNHEEGMHRAILALEMNSNSAWANYVAGQSLLFDGHPSESREPLMAALRLDPRGPLTSHFMMLIIISYYFERAYSSAVEAAMRMIARYPELPQPYRYLAAALGQIGRDDEARESLLKAMASPEAFQGYVGSCPPWYRSEDYEHMLDGLRKAGWQG